MGAYAFQIFQWTDGEQGEEVGAADDLSSAVSIACAYFIAKQTAAMSNNYTLVVANSTGGYVARIGSDAP